MGRVHCLVRSAITLVCLCVTVWNAWAASDLPPQQGEEVLAFDPHAITELSMSTKDLRLVAHRWRSNGQPFLIAVFTPNGLDTCAGGVGLVRALGGFQSLRTVRTLSAGETHQLQNGSSELVHLRFIADKDIEVDGWTFYLPAHPGDKVIGQSEHMERAAELSVGTEPFLLLKQGCRALGEAQHRH
jgi:hypothetical protein